MSEPADPQLPGAEPIAAATGCEPALPGAFTVEGLLVALDRLAAEVDGLPPAPEPVDARALLHRLRAMGRRPPPPVISHLIPGLFWVVRQGPKLLTRGAAREGLRWAGAMALRHAIGDLTHPDPSVRSAAFGVVTRFGEAAAEAVPVLTTALSDTELEMRERALVALAAVGPPAAPAAPAIIGMLSMPEPAVRAAAARALGRIGTAANRQCRTANHRFRPSATPLFHEIPPKWGGDRRGAPPVEYPCEPDAPDLRPRGVGGTPRGRRREPFRGAVGQAPVSRRRTSSASRSAEGSTPVHSRNCSTACPTNMVSPSMTGHPLARASRSNRVSSGL